MKYVLPLALAALAIPAAADAHGYTVRTLSDAHIGKSKPELVAQKTFSARVVSRYAPGRRDHWKVAARHSNCWAHLPRRWSRVCDRARRQMNLHRRLLATASARLGALAVPSHLALWRCIAGYPGARPGGGTGESGGYEGASNGSHFNVLQMTRPWGSGSYYISDPASVSAGAVIEAAERGYAANGYSTSWLSSQWGQTISPCWRFA